MMAWVALSKREGVDSYRRRNFRQVHEIDTLGACRMEYVASKLIIRIGSGIPASPMTTFSHVSCTMVFVRLGEEVLLAASFANELAGLPASWTLHLQRSLHFDLHPHSSLTRLHSKGDAAALRAPAAGCISEGPQHFCERRGFRGGWKYHSVGTQS